MPRCKNCGKTGLFLKLNARGLCDDCAALANSVPSRSSITISALGINYGKQYEHIGHSDEERVCRFFIDELSKRGRQREKFKIEHYAKDYTSLVYGLNDFLRVKYTDNVKWLTIALSEQDRLQFIDSPLFSAQENKNQSHWKSRFNDDNDLYLYVDFLVNATADLFEHYGTRRTLTDREKELADYLAKVYVECGAEYEELYLYITSNEFEIFNNSGLTGIRAKVYAKKQGGYIWFSHPTHELYKQKIPYKDFSDLGFIKDHIMPLIDKEKNNPFKPDLNLYLKYTDC